MRDITPLQSCEFLSLWLLAKRTWGEGVSLRCSEMHFPLCGDCTIAPTAVFVRQGCHQGENAQQLP